MVSTFYSSNEQKQKDYLTQRRLQEDNDFDQQERVDDELEKELGLEQRASKTALMAQRVAKKLSTLNTPEKIASVNDILLNAINNSKLTELFDKIKKIPNNKLNKKQQLIRDDLSNTENKRIINELIQEAMPNGPDAIRKTVLESLGGVENVDLVIDMINKTKDANLTQPTKISTQSKIDKTKPNVLDVVGFTDGTKLSKSKKKKGDLMEYYTSEGYDPLNEIGFTNKLPKDLLNEIGFTNKLKPTIVPRSNEVASEFKDIEILDTIIENNELTELFDELKVIPEQYLNKYEKKIQNKLKTAEVKDIINNLISKAIDTSNQKNIKYIVLNRLVDTVKERKALEDMIMKSTPATSVMSDAPKIDLRRYNKGAPKKDTNEELNIFSELLVKFNNSNDSKRKKLSNTLNNMIGRQMKENPKIAERMIELKSALHRR